MRRAHWLKHNTASETIHELIIVDTETKPYLDDEGAERHRLWFGWAAYVRRLKNGEWSRPQWVRFTKPAELWSWVEARLHGRTRLYLVAHNWGFDALVTKMFHELPKRKWKMQHACLDAPPLIVRFRRKEQSLMILDSLNWWRDSLKNLTKAAGLSKLSMHMTDDKLRWSSTKNKWVKRVKRLTAEGKVARWDAYCRRDVRVVLRMVTRWTDFLQSEDLGGFAPTLASQAFRTYRHRFMDHKILIDDSAPALELARQSYAGGRTECFRIGFIKGPVYILDVNSMYPAVMRDSEYPTRLVSVQWICQPSELRALMREFCIVADVTVEIEKPCLPLRHDGHLIFPVGRFRGTWCTPEINLALKHGKVIRVHRVAIYERAPIFKRFTEEVWRQRQQATKGGDAIRSHQWKILGNSLYGKFGQRGRYWEDVKHVRDRSIKVWQELDGDTGEWTRYRQVAGTLQRQIEEGESRDSQPCIAAHVTSAARVKLWNLMIVAGRENVYYTDTDSLWINRKGYRRLKKFIAPNRMGMLKVESIEPDVVINAPKDYQKNGVAKIKGIRKDAQEISPGVFMQAKWRGLTGALREGDLSAPKITGVLKFLARNYRKGVVDDDGNVSPLRLNLW